MFLFIGLFPLLTNAQDFSDLYEKLNPTVVTIQTTETVVSNGSLRQGGGLGTGVIIDKEGLIMTAAHVVASADAISVKTYDNQVFEAEVVSSVSAADVALLKLKKVPANISVATLGNSELVKIGDQVLVIGTPFGLEHSLSIGHISGKQKRGMMIAGEEMEFLQTDASINSGNSGGPIFSTKGEIIGIVSSILTQSGGFDGIGFAAAISPTRKILLESSPFWTGFEGIFMNESLAAIFNVPSGGGVLVQRVLSNSAADKAGLRGGQLKATILGTEIRIGGDIIISIEQTMCTSPHDFDNIKAQVANIDAGDAIKMKVLRAGKVIELDMVFK